MGYNAISVAGSPVKNVLAFWAVIYFFIGLSGTNAVGIGDFSLRSAANSANRGVGRDALSSAVRLAQSGDVSVRLGRLEEQTRRLNGRVEELNFQLLQMQERMRKIQEDNEFRFQELEERKPEKPQSSGARLPKGKKESLSSYEKGRMAQGSKADRGLTENGQGAKMIEKSGVANARETHGNEVSLNPGDKGKMPSGTIAFDDQGKVRNMVLGKPLDLTARLVRPGNNRENAVTAQTGLKFAFIDSARELYDLGYEYFQVGDYLFAQQAFSEFIERFPDDRKIPDAKYWLGESLFSQSSFKEAAKAFLDVYTNWPDSDIAPQALLKLGVSLAGMEQRELACSTYARVFRKYPDAGNLLRRRVDAERKSANCLNGW